MNRRIRDVLWSLPFLAVNIGIFYYLGTRATKAEAALHEVDNQRITCPVCPSCAPPMAKGARPNPLGNRSLSVNMGQYGDIDAARTGMISLVNYLNGCSEWFCQGLVQKLGMTTLDWFGGDIYVLVVSGVDDPTYFALCNYAWTYGGDKAWSYGRYHRCVNYSETYENRGEPD